MQRLARLARASRSSVGSRLLCQTATRPAVRLATTAKNTAKATGLSDARLSLQSATIRRVALGSLTQISPLVHHLHAAHLDALMLNSEDDEGRLFFIAFIMTT